jgi:integrase
MSRPNKIWFRKDVGWWMVTVGGKKLRLAEGRGNKKLAEQKFHELAAVRHQAPEAPTARVADVIEAFLAWTKVHRSPETNRNYVWYGQLFAEHSGLLPASELKPIHVTRWVDERKWKGTTERNARRSVYRAFSWAAEEGVLPRNPLHGMKCPGAAVRQRIMTPAEFRTLVKHSRHDFKRFLFALQQTGARPKEVRTLTWGQVRGDRWVLAQHKTAHKVGKARVIYLTAPMKKLMAVLTRSKKSNDAHVFLNGRGKPWSDTAVKQRVQRLKRNENLKLADDVSLYLLRHAFGTNAVLNGIDVATVATLMGHASLDMVSRVYVHLAGQHEHLQDAVQRATAMNDRREPANRSNR